MDKPEIVCLCGSTRFMDAFFEAGWKFTLEGKIVLSVGVCKHAEHHGAEALGQDVAEKLDEFKFQSKIKSIINQELPQIIVFI